jgi:DNA recombination protein RmuC
LSPEVVAALLVPVALAFGAVVGWTLHARLVGSSAASIEAQALLRRSQADVAKLERDAAALRDRLGAAQSDRARLEAQLEEGARRADEQRRVLAETEARFREAFRSLAAEALKSNNQAFLDLAKTAMGEVQREAQAELDKRRSAIDQTVAPVRDALEKFDAAVRAIEKERLGAYTDLRAQVEALKSGQQSLLSETANLVKALRSPTTRGKWGEYQLRRVVELAGMVENCDFVEQKHVAGDDGSLRPDVVVHLPGRKTTVIDAKVPLQAYLEAIEADDEPRRRKAIAAHAAQLRKHVEQLGSRAYWDQLASSPDFVILYVPIESAFTAALQADPGLIDDAVARRVIPCGPMTLLTHLKSAAYGWRQERIADNAQKISKLGSVLYGRLAKLADHLNDLGRHLGQATDAYNQAVGSVELRVLAAARRFKKLGAATGDDLPQLEPVSQQPRALTSPELAPRSAVEPKAEEQPA